MTGLYYRLFDDAALFPPGNAAMPDAVAAHRLLRAGLGEYVGPFVVPVARLDELVAASGADLELAVIAAPSELGEALDRALPITAFEVPPVPAKDLPGALRRADEAVPADVICAFEVPRNDERDTYLDALAGTRHRAKLRTGGVRAELFPSSTELADTIAACLRRSVPFKCTAGLHHAIRHVDPATGFEHHGFLNVLSATAALADGAEVAAAVTLLEERRPEVVAARVQELASVSGLRATFTSFGTCSVTEPLADLAGLGLVDAAIAARGAS